MNTVIVFLLLTALVIATEATPLPAVRYCFIFSVFDNSYLSFVVGYPGYPIPILNFRPELPTVSTSTLDLSEAARRSAELSEF